MISNKDVVLQLTKIHHPNSGLKIIGKCESDLSGVTIMDDSSLSFTFEDVLTKKKEMEAAEPMRILREERNRKLTETDWWAGQDLTMTQEQKDYRQALRDLPSTASPTLDEQGNLTNVTWPTKPT